MRLRTGLAAAVAASLVLFVFTSSICTSRAAENLPSQLSDAEYWKIISDFSEPSGYFQHEIVTSNEISYQYVLPQLMRTARSAGTYLGVGPEQNFTYIAALQPKIAFVIDIRRDMMLEHLLYKSIFEMSTDRTEFVAFLFSRKAPAQLTADSPVQTIFQAFGRISPDMTLAEEHLKDHGATVSVFYISNVEDYIQAVWRQYASNIASLPFDASSVFIRWSPGSSTSLASIADFVRASRRAPR